MKKIIKGFTLIELLVVVAIMGAFGMIAYPNITKWIEDREVKKEVYEVVSFIKERKAEVDSGEYGMTILLLNRIMEVYTMKPNFFTQTYKSISSKDPYKLTNSCMWNQSGMTRRTDLERSDLEMGPYNPESNVHIYPSAWHNPQRTAICLTKDGTIRFRKYANGTDIDKELAKLSMFLCFAQKKTLQKKHAN
jgi:prepilin-type N-terminal cleavage/methylation domain-containing protein